MPRKVVINKPRLADYQHSMLYCEEKHTICEASTKAGKTLSHMWWIFEEAHKATKRGANFWWVAPIYSQAKIAFTRMKRVVVDKKGYTVNLTELTISTPNGAVIWFKSADNPDSLYGEDVHCCVLDEASRMKEESFFAVRSTLTATDGRMKIIGNVKGTGNWAYKLALRVQAGELPNWKYFKITCDDAIKAGILSEQAIAEAKSIYPNGVFLELYYGIPFANSSSKFAFSFNKEVHVASCEVDYNYPIYLSFDFNINPITCIVGQVINNQLNITHAIKLENSNIYELCKVIKNKFTIPGKSRPTFIVTGDATGRASNAMVQGQLNYYRVIKSELELTIQQMRQPTINPKIEASQILVNAVLEHVPIHIDPTNAQGLIFDMEFVQMNPDGTMKKANRSDATQHSDFMDGFRYLTQLLYSHMIDRLSTTPISTRRYAPVLN